MKNLTFTFYLWLALVLLFSFFATQTNINPFTFSCSLLSALCGAGAYQDYRKANRKW